MFKCEEPQYFNGKNKFFFPSLEILLVFHFFIMFLAVARLVMILRSELNEVEGACPRRQFPVPDQNVFRNTIEREVEDALLGQGDNGLDTERRSNIL